MNTMKKLVKDFEEQLWKITGRFTPKLAVGEISYSVRYIIPNRNGAILIMAFDDDTFHIAFFKGTQILEENLIYKTEDTANLIHAEYALNSLINIIADSAYFGYDFSIEEYAEAFKKKAGC